MHKAVWTPASVLVQSKGRSQFIVRSRYNRAPAVPSRQNFPRKVTPSPSWNPEEHRIFAVPLQGHCIWAAGCVCLIVLSTGWTTPRLWPAPCSCMPRLLEPHPCLLHVQEGTSRHHRAPATFCCRSCLLFNEITAYLFLLFSVYLLCFPVHKLFFTSFLKELLFNSIAGTNYCITFLQRSIRAMIECNTNTKTHAQTFPELNPCNTVH